MLKHDILGLIGYEDKTQYEIEKFYNSQNHYNWFGAKFSNTQFELNEKYKDFPERVSEYELDGKKYIVHSRFVGEKNIDEVIGRLAFERAVKETLA